MLIYYILPIDKCMAVDYYYVEFIKLYYMLYTAVLLVFFTRPNCPTNCFVNTSSHYFIPFFCAIWQYRFSLQIYHRRVQYPPSPHTPAHVNIYSKRLLLPGLLRYSGGRRMGGGGAAPPGSYIYWGIRGRSYFYYRDNYTAKSLPT